MERLEKKAGELLEEAQKSHLLDMAAFHAAMEPVFREEGFREEAEDGIQSIIVARLDVMGDNILTSPMLRELRRNFPGARIVLVTSSAAYSLMELCPYVNEVLRFDLAEKGRNPLDVVRDIIGFCKEHLWQYRYDCCILPLWGVFSLMMRVFVYLTGARRRVGYSDTVVNHWLPPQAHAKPTNEGYLLTEAVLNPPEIIHEVDRYLYLLEAMGMERATNRQTELWIGRTDMQRARALLGDFGKDGILVAMSTGAGGDSRRYPVEQWLEAMQEIAALGGRFVLIGGKQEMEDQEFLRQRMSPETLLPLVGKTSMRESAAVISCARIFMGNATGMMHAAAACNRPILVLFREAMDKDGVCTGVLSEFRRFEPRGRYFAVRPVHALGDCKGALAYGGCASLKAHCIRQIPAGMVVQAFRMVMQEMKK